MFLCDLFRWVGSDRRWHFPPRWWNCTWAGLAGQQWGSLPSPFGTQLFSFPLESLEGIEILTARCRTILAQNLYLLPTQEPLPWYGGIYSTSSHHQLSDQRTCTWGRCSTFPSTPPRSCACGLLPHCGHWCSNLPFLLRCIFQLEFQDSKISSTVFGELSVSAGHFPQLLRDGWFLDALASPKLTDRLDVFRLQI